MTKSFSMAGWRVAFLVGNAEMVAALAKLKSYLDYGTFQPIQIAATVTLNEATEHPKLVRDIYQSRRDVLCDGLNRIGWEVEPPRGTMFVWAPIPPAYDEMGSLEFSSFLVQEANVATSPGEGFGPGGDGHVRFALIENEQRTRQAIRNLRAGPDQARRASSRRSRGLRARKRGVHTPAVASHRHGRRRIAPLDPVGARRSRTTRPAWLHGTETPPRGRSRSRRMSPSPSSCGSGCPTGPARWAAVASRIGAVQGDVAGIEILERGAGRAVDDIVVDLPACRPGRPAGAGDQRGRRGRRRRAPGRGRRRGRPLARRGGGGRPARRARPATTSCSSSLCDRAYRAVGGAWAAVVELDGGRTGGRPRGTPPSAAWLSAFVEGSQASARLGAVTRWGERRDLGAAALQPGWR